MPPVAHIPQRRHRRRNLAASLAVLVRGHLVRGLTVNIGEGGLGAALPLALGIGEKVIVNLEQFELVLLASVRHHEGFLHGFEFHLLAPRQHEVLRQLCANA
jgi:hypothetical protein